ncbi:MAG: maleylacetoacetate isomerase [Chromatiales bacterium]
MSSGLVLYTYFRSSAAYRVRIALNLKRLYYEPRFVHLLSGEQNGSDYLKVNPQGRIPALVDGNTVLTQSLAIIEYLEECHPETPLLPREPVERAFVRSVAQLVACDIHPLNNLRVQQYLREQFFADDVACHIWMRHWIEGGFAALEQRLRDHGTNGQYCFGNHPTLADVCLIPQVFNAKRVACDLAPFPTIAAIDAHCRALAAFARAAPENQPDAQ